MSEIRRVFKSTGVMRVELMVLKCLLFKLLFLCQLKCLLFTERDRKEEPCKRRSHSSENKTTVLVGTANTVLGFELTTAGHKFRARFDKID